jgi:hypothetical protein
MSVNFEIKGMLARLLATEDLIVEHKKVETACFNVHTRLLTLPLWEKASNVVYDMLVAHEVSHALYTPDEDMTSLGVPHQFVNIVEDARVEKLIKRRYMGLSKTFYGAYKELQEQDFFSLENEDISTMNLADRVNLYFKVGNFVPIIFNLEEQEIVNEIAAIETFEETIAAAKKLYEYCKQEQKKEQQQLPETNSHQQGGGNQGSQPEQQTELFGDGDDEKETGSQPEPDPFSNGEQPMNESAGQSSSPIGEEERDPELKTVDSLQKAIESLVNKNGYENHYVEVPLLNPETVIVNNKEIHSYIGEYYREQQTFYDEESTKYNRITHRNIFEQCDSDYEKFKKSAQKEVNYLVKEFECKKAADSYARATTARTGVLDCSKLHTYKFNDDIFRKVTTLSDGKNHGLIFILDWSGSMANVMLDTIKQLYNLVWFCKKVSIPFEVYAFTGDWMRVSYDSNGKPIYPQPHCEKKSGMFAVDERFNLLNFLTNSVNGKTLEEQMLNLWRVVSCFRGNTGLPYPPRLALSGTPLNETIISLHSVIPHFQKNNKVQKVQCVVLTDGEAAPINYHLEIQRYTDLEPYMGTRRISPSTTFIRDRKLGTTYKIGDEYQEFTDALLRNLRDNFSDVNFIGMRIMDGRDAGCFIKRYCGYYGNEHDKAMSDWKKNKSFTITNSAYSGYFGMSSSALAQESEFEVSEDATKNQIKSAFVKSLKTKKLNKKILGEFVELIV